MDNKDISSYSNHCISWNVFLLENADVFLATQPQLALW